MLEITRKNCFKCDLETIINNDSQYFWINLKDSESKWLNIFNKHDNLSTLKYRRELTPNIKFQADIIFVRNDLFEQIIKSCKATNVEFTMLKEKLGICPYEKNYNKKSFDELLDEFLDESEEEFYEELNKEFGKESNKESNKNSNKESNKELNKESSKESNKELNKNSNKESNKESNKKLIEITNPKKDEDATDWYDQNKFKKILSTIDSNNFNHKNKTGKLKFNDINNLINKIKNNKQKQMKQMLNKN